MGSRRTLVLGLGLSVLVGAGAACDRQMEPYVPGEKPHTPDLSRIFPKGAELAAREEGRRPAPATRPAAGQRDDGRPIRGTVAVAEALAGRVPPDAVLFLVARRGDAGPPLAVRRVPGPRFPFSFELGPQDRMIASIPFAGPITLSARIDGDGNATTRSPGDLQGVLAKPVQPGDEGIIVVIDEAL